MMIKLEGYDSCDEYVFYHPQQMMDFITKWLGEGWYFEQDIVYSSDGHAAFIVRR